MLDKGWILQLPTEDGSRQKKYELTNKGLKVLLGEIERLKELVKTGNWLQEGNRRKRNGT